MPTAKKRFKIIPAVYLVLKRDGKILLSRRYNTGHEDGNYSLVAGHLEGNESFRQAMTREVKEETNLIIDVNELEVAHITHKRKMAGDDGERIDIFLIADRWKGKLKNMEPDKCDDLKWFSMDDLPKNIVPYVKHALDKIEENKFYSELGF